MSGSNFYWYDRYVKIEHKIDSKNSENIDNKSHIQNVDFYKKYKKHEHVYDYKLNQDFEERDFSNFYKSLSGKNGWIISSEKLSENKNIDLLDPGITWMDGYYIAKTWFTNNQILYVGSDESFMKGFLYHLPNCNMNVILQNNQRNIHNTLRNLNYINGKNNNDMSVNNMLFYLNKIYTKKYNLIFDFTNKQTDQYYVMLAIILICVDQTGVIKLPSIETWDLHIMSILEILRVYFSQTIIFKTPWGLRKNYYIIFRIKRRKFDKIKYLLYYEYIKDLINSDVIYYPLSNWYLNQEKIEYYSNVFVKLSNIKNNTSNESQANDQWFNFSST